MLRGDLSSNEFKLLKEFTNIVDKSEQLINTLSSAESRGPNGQKLLPGVRGMEKNAPETPEQTIQKQKVNSAVLERIINNLTEIQDEALMDHLANLLVEKIFEMDDEKLRENIVWVLQQKNQKKMSELKALARKTKRTELLMKIQIEHWQSVTNRLASRVENSLCCGSMQIAAGRPGISPESSEFEPAFVFLHRESIDFYGFINEEESFLTLKRENIEDIISVKLQDAFYGYMVLLKQQPLSERTCLYLLCTKNNNFVKWNAPLLNFKMIDSLAPENLALNFCGPSVFETIEGILKQRCKESKPFSEELNIYFKSSSEMALVSKLRDIALKEYNIEEHFNADYLEEMLIGDLREVIGGDVNEQKLLGDSSFESEDSEDKDKDKETNNEASEHEEIIKKRKNQQVFTGEKPMGEEQALKLLRVGFHVNRFYAYKKPAKRLLVLSRSMVIELRVQGDIEEIEDFVEINDIEKLLKGNSSKNLSKSTRPNHCLTIKSSDKGFDLEFHIIKELDDFIKAVCILTGKNF